MKYQGHPRETSWLVTVCWGWGPTLFLLLAFWASQAGTVRL